MRIEKAKIRQPVKKEKYIRTKQRVSAYTESYKGEYYNIDIDKLIPFKNQSRKSFDQQSLMELAQTIKTHGIRQPLTVLPSEEEEGKYEIVSGERRWRAAQIISLKKLPCIILQDKNVAEEIALIENVQRKNLHPLELMQGLKNLLDKKICKNHQEIADKIGIARSVVVETLKLGKLPSSTQKMLLEKKIKSREVLRQLVKEPQQNHSQIINNEYQEKKKKIFTRKKTIKKNKIISIYLQEEELVVDEIKNLILTEEQKINLKIYIQKLASRL